MALWSPSPLGTKEIARYRSLIEQARLILDTAGPESTVGILSTARFIFFLHHGPRYPMTHAPLLPSSSESPA